MRKTHTDVSPTSFHFHQTLDSNIPTHWNIPTYLNTPTYLRVGKWEPMSRLPYWSNAYSPGPSDDLFLWLPRVDSPSECSHLALSPLLHNPLWLPRALMLRRCALLRWSRYITRMLWYFCASAHAPPPYTTPTFVIRHVSQLWLLTFNPLARSTHSAVLVVLVSIFVFEKRLSYYNKSQCSWLTIH